MTTYDNPSPARREEDIMDTTRRMPPEKKGLSTGAKIGIGIGALLLISTCVGGIAYVGTHAEELAKKGNEYVRAATAEQWREMRLATEQVMTDEGARAFYADHPRVKVNYPTEEVFLEAVRAWRPRLEPVPEVMPDLKSGQVSAYINTNNGVRGVRLAYRNGRSARTEMIWQAGEIIDISVR